MVQRMTSYLRLCAASVFLALAVGCGYGEVSPHTYEYAKALYSICNRRAGDQIGNARQQIQSHHEQGKLSKKEAQWLADILDDAQAGKWESAASASRRMMENQVREK